MVVVYCVLVVYLFCLVAVPTWVLTHLKPMNDRPTFWYSDVRHADLMKLSGSFHEPPRTDFRFSA